MEPPSPSRVAAEPTDLLSSLPAALLDEILRRLDLRDAVRTSVLSRAWRRCWESVPGLALCFPEGTPPCTVDRVLFQYACPSVSRFAFHADGGSVSHVDHWLLALSRRRGVKSIAIRWDVVTSDPDAFTLHSSIFSCAGLVSLRLHWCRIPCARGAIPRQCRLLNLRAIAGYYSWVTPAACPFSRGWSGLCGHDCCAQSP